MEKTIKLTASARYGYGGKQYIARIVGRDPKFTFAREFVGRKSGKRRDYSEHITDEPGLYITCDLDSKGRKEETFFLLEEIEGGLEKYTVNREQAMGLARLFDSGSTLQQAVNSVFPPKPKQDSGFDPIELGM